MNDDDLGFVPDQQADDGLGFVPETSPYKQAAMDAVQAAGKTFTAPWDFTQKLAQQDPAKIRKPQGLGIRLPGPRLVRHSRLLRAVFQFRLGQELAN